MTGLPDGWASLVHFIRFLMKWTVFKETTLLGRDVVAMEWPRRPL